MCVYAYVTIMGSLTTSATRLMSSIINHEEEAVDAEVVIPNVSDKFNGKAPDLRASKSVVLKSSTENATLIQSKNYIAD